MKCLQKLILHYTNIHQELFSIALKEKGYGHPNAKLIAYFCVKKNIVMSNLFEYSSHVLTSDYPEEL